MNFIILASLSLHFITQNSIDAFCICMQGYGRYEYYESHPTLHKKVVKTPHTLHALATHV